MHCSPCHYPLYLGFHGPHFCIPSPQACFLFKQTSLLMLQCSIDKAACCRSTSVDVRWPQPIQTLKLHTTGFLNCELACNLSGVTAQMYETCLTGHQAQLDTLLHPDLKSFPPLIKLLYHTTPNICELVVKLKCPDRTPAESMLAESHTYLHKVANNLLSRLSSVSRQ